MPKERWEILEQFVQATFPGAMRTKGSGSVNRDGDLLAPRFLIECKCKAVGGISVSKAEILKATQQAIRKGKKPLIVFENETGRRFACVDYDELVKLEESLRMWEDHTPGEGP